MVEPRVSPDVLEEVRLAILCDDAPSRLRALSARLLTGAAEARAAAATTDGDEGDTPARRLSRDAAWTCVLTDLTAQGWHVRVDAPRVSLVAPSPDKVAGETSSDVKARIRASLEAMREEALAEAPTREFVRRVETRRAWQTRRYSVLDLVDDGEELSQALRASSDLPAERRAAHLASVIRPEIEPVVAGARCAVTNIELLDVWRYFRLTWALPYRSTPGRTFPFLVRNAARPGRPVIGIGALASPVAQLSRRDDWIGWTLSALKRRAAADPTWWATQLEALRTTIETALSETRVDDLLLDAPRRVGADLEAAFLEISRDAAARRIAALQPLRRPAGDASVAPNEDAVGASDDDGLAAMGRGLPRVANGEIDWRTASEDLLFKRKRAKIGADLLFAHRILASAPSSPDEGLARLETDESFARAVSIGLRECRKVGLASRVLDLSVCGAVPPYGPLLAGKLVALSVASAELRAAYRERYSGQVSEIASQMAGREIRRSADYLAIATTSLYGVASSQYNRLALSVGSGEPGSIVRWQDLGRSLGFGTVHLSRRTLGALTDTIIAHFGGLNVNYRFGEGNSPTLRQAREGLQLIVQEPNAILNHEALRRVYGLAVQDDALRALCLNREARVYSPPLEAIADAWRSRWLSGRVERGDALASVASQGRDTVRARVAAQPDEQDSQLAFFGASERA